MVAHPDGNNLSKVAVRAVNNGGWVSMSGAGMSYGAATNVRIAIHPTLGAPYVAFIEPANGNKITVMKTAFDAP